MASNLFKVQLCYFSLCLSPLHTQRPHSRNSSSTHHGARWYTAPGCISSMEYMSLKVPISRKPCQPLRMRKLLKSSSEYSVLFSVLPVGIPDSSYKHTFTNNPGLNNQSQENRSVFSQFMWIFCSIEQLNICNVITTITCQWMLFDCQTNILYLWKYRKGTCLGPDWENTE